MRWLDENRSKSGARRTDIWRTKEHESERKKERSVGDRMRRIECSGGGGNRMQGAREMSGDTGNETRGGWWKSRNYWRK